MEQQETIDVTKDAEQPSSEQTRVERLVSQHVCSVNPHADEFDEAEWRLRQDIEEAIEQAADCLHDAPSWWATEEKGPRTIDTLIGMIVVAAKDYKNRLDNKENVY